MTRLLRAICPTTARPTGTSGRTPLFTNHVPDSTTSRLVPDLPRAPLKNWLNQAKCPSSALESVCKGSYPLLPDCPLPTRARGTTRMTDLAAATDPHQPA